MVHDGLWCAFEQCHMGVSGEVVADEYHVSRDDQDRYAVESHRRAAQATETGWFRDEIVPITLAQKKGDPLVVDQRRVDPARHHAGGACEAASRVQG